MVSNYRGRAHKSYAIIVREPYGELGHGNVLTGYLLHCTHVGRDSISPTGGAPVRIGFYQLRLKRLDRVCGPRPLFGMVDKPEAILEQGQHRSEEHTSEL